MGSASSRWAEKKKSIYFSDAASLSLPCPLHASQGRYVQVLHAPRQDAPLRSLEKIQFMLKMVSLLLWMLPPHQSSPCGEHPRRPQGASEENPKWPEILRHCLAPYFAFSSYIFWCRLAKQGPLLLAHSFLRLGFVGVVDTWLPYVKN